MAWRFEGTYFENCSCDMICPCTYSNFSLPATSDRCQALLAFHIDSGDVDNLTLDGLSFALFVDAPQVMAEGGWRVGLFLDAKASPSRARSSGRCCPAWVGRRRCSDRSSERCSGSRPSRSSTPTRGAGTGCG